MPKPEPKSKPPNPFDSLGSAQPPKPTIDPAKKAAMMDNARNASGYDAGAKPKTNPAKAKSDPKPKPAPKPVAKKSLVKRRKRAAPVTEVFSARLEPETINGFNDYADESGLPMRQVMKDAWQALQEKQIKAGN